MCWQYAMNQVRRLKMVCACALICTPHPLTVTMAWRFLRSWIEESAFGYIYIYIYIHTHTHTHTHTQCDSKRWTQLKSKRRLNTRRTVGCGIPSSLLALLVDLRGLRSKLSWIRLTFSSDTRHFALNWCCCTALRYASALAMTLKLFGLPLSNVM